MGAGPWRTAGPWWRDSQVMHAGPRRPHRMRRHLSVLATTLTLALGACGTYGAVKGLLIGESGTGADRHLTGFIGGVAADEPQAAIIGRDILRRGGNAADAATAVGLALAVTLPSRASLGGGGACLAFTPEHGSRERGVVTAVMFLPRPGQSGGDRPAAVPATLRGLFTLQDRFGRTQFPELVEPAETLARHGFPVSHLLGSDLDVVGAALLADPRARAVFTTPDGVPVGENDTLIEGDLGNTLEQVRLIGPGALLTGPVANAFASGSAAAGGSVTRDDLRQAQASLVDPVTLAGAGNDRGLNLAFTPLPADGGIAAARAFRLLEGDPEADAAALAESEATASYARTTGARAEAILDAQLPTGTLPPLPASTSFVTVDRTGGAVACDLTMGNLFGTGRIAGSTGIVLAASPADHPAPLLPLAIAYDKATGDFRAAVAASGQNEAAAAVAEALADTLRTHKPNVRPVTHAGRINVIACPDLLPGGSATCGGATDSRGTGLALGND